MHMQLCFIVFVEQRVIEKQSRYYDIFFAIIFKQYVTKESRNKGQCPMARRGDGRATGTRFADKSWLQLKKGKSGRLYVFTLGVALDLEVSRLPGGVVIGLVGERLVLLLAHHKGRAGDVLGLLVGEGLGEEQVDGEDEEAEDGEDHEDDVRDEVAVGDLRGGLALAGLGREGEGEDEDGGDEQPGEGVELGAAGAAAGEAPEDGEDDCDDYDERAHAHAEHARGGGGLAGDAVREEEEGQEGAEGGEGGARHLNVIGLVLLKQFKGSRFKSIQKMQGGLGDILHHEEIRELIGRVRQMEVREYASAAWFKQDESLQRLNMQLHINALMKTDEYILEECVTQDKFRVLIYDLILTATWKEKVLPRIRALGQPPNSLKLYLALYHESVVCNILETFMFYRTAIDESGDFLIELIDYCYRKISRQVGESVRRRKAEREEERRASQLSEEERREAKVSRILRRSAEEELDGQIQDIEFKLFIMCVSMVRYITDYLKHLEIGILHHLLIDCNIFSLLVPLIEERPWLRTTEKGEREVFEDGKWALVPKSEYGKLPKTEAQVWITIFNLYMSPECNKKYEINDERKNSLLRLRKYLNEVLLDQIPNLSYMLRSLEELSIMNVPTHLTTPPFVVQQVPVMAGEIGRGQDWDELAREQLERLRQSMDESERAHMMKLADLYTNSDIEGLTEGFKCGKCQQQAFKRCSKCKAVWYCSKDCQVADWPAHKPACNKKAKELREAEEGRKKEVVLPKKPSIDELD